MKINNFYIFPLILFICLLLHTTSIYADFSRLFVVEFTGEKCPELIGEKINSIRIITYTENGWKPIPFQVDKKDKNGLYLFPKDKEYSRNRLSKFDEFVLQGEDLGSMAPPEKINKILNTTKIKVTKEGISRYAYIGLFSFPKSDKDYIKFDPKTSGIVTDFYTVSCHPSNPSFFSEIIMGGVDHLDRVKLRATAKLLFGSLTIQRTEEDIIGRPVEIIDGPVRVLQRIEYRVRIISGIHSPTMSRVTKSYRAVYLIPNNMNIPFNMNLVFTSLNSIAAFDFTPQISGAKIFCAQCGEGFTVNGKMDSDEFRDTGIGSQSAALCSKFGTMIMSVKTTSEVENLPIKAGGIYIDDQNDPDPPEDIPGRFGWFGYRLDELHKVEKGNYVFYMALLFPENCPAFDAIDQVANQYWSDYSVETRFSFGKAK